MFGELLADLKEKKDKLQAKKENDEQKIKELAVQFNDKSFINQIEKEKEQIQYLQYHIQEIMSANRIQFIENERTGRVDLVQFVIDVQRFQETEKQKDQY